jgi:hypothetical protein
VFILDQANSLIAADRRRLLGLWASFLVLASLVANAGLSIEEGNT